MSMPEIALVLVIAVILFAPDDLPVVARALGKIILQVRKYTDELTREFRGALSAPSSFVENVFKDQPKNKPDQSKNRTEDEELLSYQEIEEPSPHNQENQKDMQAGE